MRYRYIVFDQTSFLSLARVMSGIFLFFATAILLAGCSQKRETSPFILNPSPTGLAVKPQNPTNTELPAPTSTPTQVPVSFWLAPYLPETLRSAIKMPDGYTLTSSSEQADITMEMAEEDGSTAIQWIYVLVAPFPTITDGVTSADLQNAWEGNPLDSFKDAPLLMDESTLGVMTAFWGAPAPQAVLVQPTGELIEYAWSNRPSWAIVPFEELNARWKTLTIDGQSPVRKDFDPSSYPLKVPFTLSGSTNLPLDAFSLPSTNREASKLTTLAMTGVTAMVRATAWTMEESGITYPAKDIGSLLAEADITHISNEIPFTPDCPYPSMVMNALVFCSDPKYIDLLKAVGTDIIELTGDHFMDYGKDATLYTLQMYKDLGWQYYGGGADAEEARQPVLIENNGNKLAFLGCNIGCEVKTEIPCDAIATDSHPGAGKCDFDWLSTEIPSLKDEGYQVIFTFQHREYYTYTTEPILAEDFGRIAAAGADIVSGSQAHQPHGFAFADQSYIHYGLGNLFFDQWHYCDHYACDDAFIDRHVFYAGQYINTELITIRFVDFARPRLMTTDERGNFLKIIFNASGW
jgi:poly-gamma-glutamate synthesis protein (capsule biosynthesis protein)